MLVNVCVASNCTISSFAIPSICVAVAALPVVEPDDPLTFPVTFPVTSPVNIASVPSVPLSNILLKPSLA